MLPKKMGRPVKEVDLDKLAILCEYPMINNDIAALMDLSVDTIERAVRKEYNLTFAEYKDQRQSHLRKTLLAKQIEVAKNGNVAMLIWLGKQYLGQSEKQEVAAVVSSIKINKAEENL